MADHPASDETEGLLRKIGLELAFLDLKTAADTATLARLLEAFQAATAAAPPELPAAAAVLAGWLAGEASRPADLTAAFSEWHAWASESLTAWRQDRALPPLPALLEHATVGPLEPPAADATRWQPPGVEAAAGRLIDFETKLTQPWSQGNETCVPRPLPAWAAADAEAWYAAVQVVVNKYVAHSG